MVDLDTSIAGHATHPADRHSPFASTIPRQPDTPIRLPTATTGLPGTPDSLPTVKFVLPTYPAGLPHTTLPMPIPAIPSPFMPTRLSAGQPAMSHPKVAPSLTAR